MPSSGAKIQMRLKDWICFSLFLIPALFLANDVVVLPSENSERLAQHPRSKPTTNPANTHGSTPATDHSRALKVLAQKSPLKVYSSCSVSNSFSLTFDDGPTELSARLDKTLENANLRATFFINGNNYGCIYDQSDLLIDRFKKGHLIGSHTWSHVHLNEGTYQQVNLQLELLERAMIKILGVKPLYFRPPYGEYNDNVIQVLRDRGYKGLILWSEDSGDSFSPPPSSSQIIASYDNYPEKTIVLNHETHDFTVDEVIPAVIPKLKGKGFKLTRVADCLNLGSNPKDWYEFVQGPGSRDDSWTCSGTPDPGQFE